MKTALLLTMSAAAAFCQQAQISGLIQDPNGLNVDGAAISVRSEETGGQRATQSNQAGFYSIASLKPGTYRIAVRAMGFQTIVQEGVKLEVGDSARLDFMMRIGDFRTVVTVNGAPPLVNTEDASVGTLIGRDFIDKMPLNGRGIQSLIELTPGVEAVPVLLTNTGQFSINGQRTDTNYFTVDGVSANFAAGAVGGIGGGLVLGSNILQAGGSLPANSVFGTFSNLVSPDALQEFRIQTSTFAPEFGHAPGAQIGFITRSGTARYSGSLFEYLRNDIFDANDWFSNQQGLPKAPLRFNNFGGTLGGPLKIPRVFKRLDRTFFFFSFEDLVMRQPQPVVTFAVPDEQTRLSASPVAALFYNAFPLPNRPGSAAGISTPGRGAYAQNYSASTDQQTWGLRLDHYFSDKLIGFLRSNQAPSNATSQPPNATSLQAVEELVFTADTRTLTAGLTLSATPILVNDIRANSSWQDVGSGYRFLPRGGAPDPFDVLFPHGYSAQDSWASLGYADVPSPVIVVGKAIRNHSRQLQIVDQLSWVRGAHQWKFGADYLRITLFSAPPRTQTTVTFSDHSPDGVTTNTYIISYRPANLTYQAPAFSLYAQDTWHVSPKLTLTYGLRWELTPAPRASRDLPVYQQLTRAGDSAGFAAAPPGTPFYRTRYREIAPRLGLAWQAHDGPLGKTVVRAGAGVFYDLGQSGFENGAAQPFLYYRGTNVPLGEFPSGPPAGYFPGFPVVASADYTLPRTYEWNLTLEQSLGQQTFSAAYVGALGRRLTGAHQETAPYLNLPNGVFLLGSKFSSSYNALQLQFNRRLSRRFQALVSYTWSHSIDNLSSQLEGGVTLLNLEFFEHPNLNRGASDFDVRHSLHGAIFASLPAPRNGPAAVLFRNWTASSIFFVRSALPTEVLMGGAVYFRPDLVLGEPLYLYGASYPGGKRYNPAAFTAPPAGALEGDLGRNVLRGFGAWQIDLALHRQFRLSEHAGLQFRAEAFNVFNHPNFANPSNPRSQTLAGDVGSATFGLSQMTLGSWLSHSGSLGQLNPLFQAGGPRQLQFALRLSF